MTKSLLIADDDQIVRSLLGTQLGDDFDVVALAEDAEQAIAAAREHRPDVALLDVQMPHGGGLRAVREIERDSPASALVALSADESHETVVEMLNAGAMSYIRKGQPVADIVATLTRSIEAQARLGDAG